MPCCAWADPLCVLPVRGSVWQDATGKECGLHSGNVGQSATEEAKAEATDLWTDSAVEPLSKEQLAQLKQGPRDKDTLVVLYAPWCQYSQVSRTLPAPMHGYSRRIAA